MAITRRLLPVVALVITTLLVSVQARANEDLRRYVDKNTQQLVNKLNAERGLYAKNPEAFYESMNAELKDFVDFRRIAARVMGRYARQATPEQRDEFVEKFKRSLFDSYAQALVAADDFTITVKEATVDPSNDSRASVAMEVESAAGNRYPVSYSMYRNDEGKWLMENVIVEGVNTGLAFRDRFAQEMESKRGKVQAVIDDWSKAVDALELEEGDDKS